VVKRKLPSLNNKKGNFRADLSEVSPSERELAVTCRYFCENPNYSKMLFTKFFWKHQKMKFAFKLFMRLNK